VATRNGLNFASGMTNSESGFWRRNWKES
jgi:hypothetical protein